MIRNLPESAHRMKRLTARVIAAAVLFGGQALASPAAGGQPPSPERMLAHMTARLNLTDAQTEQIRQVFENHQAQATAQFQALRSARQALHQATMAAPVNEGAIRNAAQALAQAEGDQAVLHAQIHAQILPLLNADQQEKFQTLGEGRHGRWKSHSFGTTD